MNKKRESLLGIIYLSPWIIGFLGLTLFPLGYSIYLGFQQVKITADGILTTGVGFSNYIESLTTDIEFVNRLIDFVKEIIISVPLIVILALIIALLLEQPIKFKGVFRTIFFLPVIIISGPVLEKVLGFNRSSLSISQVDAMLSVFSRWLPDIILKIIFYVFDNIILLLWFSGVQILIFINGLQKIGSQIYEAAAIDGASAWETFWKITLPMITPMIFVNIIYTTVIFATSEINPIIDYIKNNMFKIETGFGYASALSWIYFIAILLVLAIFLLVGRFFSKSRNSK